MLPKEAAPVCQHDLLNLPANVDPVLFVVGLWIKSLVTFEITEHIFNCG